MKNSDFTKFLNLMEEREPVFGEALATANNAIMKGSINHESYFEPDMSNPRNLLSSPQSYSNISAGTLSILPVYEKGMQLGDASSGSDLDVLLAYSIQQAAEDQQPKNILNQCHVWPSTQFDDPEWINETPNKSPRLQRSQRWRQRYQILPFYSTERWQLAVFDITGNSMVCYDSMWTSGLPNFTFRVGKAV